MPCKSFYDFMAVRSAITKLQNNPYKHDFLKWRVKLRVLIIKYRLLTRRMKENLFSFLASTRPHGEGPTQVMAYWTVQNTIKQKDIISYQLTILMATSWKQNDLKNKTEWVSKTKCQLCCPFVPTFSQQIKTHLTAGCFTVRPLIEVCSSSFSMSWFYEAAPQRLST